MQAATEQLYASHGDTIVSTFMLERLEYLSNEGDPLTVWEGQGWLGGDIQKLWLKTEGEYLLDQGEFEEAELQVLYSRAIHPFWDVQLGLRHDIKPDPSRSYLATGLQGTAPYWFEIDGALFLSNKGDVSARLELEYELRLTQRLILQPRAELNAAFSDDAAIGVGSGLSTVQAGLRMRYEISPQFAPYLGVSWQRAFGDTADFSEGHGDATTSVVAGVRMWF
jgi:copper resistance protein B